MPVQFILDEKGNKISVILPIKQYNAMLEKLDELACITAYDEVIAKKGIVFLPFRAAKKANKHKGK